MLANIWMLFIDITWIFYKTTSIFYKITSVFYFFSLCILPTKAYWAEEGDIESHLMSVFLLMLSCDFYSVSLRILVLCYLMSKDM